MEVHLDVDQYRGGLTIIHGGFESISANRLNGLFAQPIVQRPHNPHMLRSSIHINDQGDDANSFVVCPSRLIGILCFNIVNRDRSADSATDVVGMEKSIVGILKGKAGCSRDRFFWRLWEGTEFLHRLRYQP